MFERFTDRARRVVVLAQEEARRLDHSFIGTEHLLLGLLAEETGIAAQVLTSLGISLEAARVEVEGIIGRGAASAPGSVPFTPRAKKVLEMSLREALQLGHNYIGTEHLLLGLIREGEGVAAHVLVKLGAGLGVTRERVAMVLGEKAGTGRPPPIEVGTVLLNSLRSENARLRQEVDHLRAVLSRFHAAAGAEQTPEATEGPPGGDQPTGDDPESEPEPG